MIIICSGMFRSGSTWQYLVAGDLLTRSGRPVKPLGFLEGDRLAARIAQGFSEYYEYLFKTHNANAMMQPLIDAGAVVLYSYRDLRDVAYSMAHKLSVGFWEAVRDHDILGTCLRNDESWRTQPNVFQMRYEEMIRDEAGAVAAIADRLSVRLKPDEASEIADRFSLESNRKRTDQLANELRQSGANLSDRANTFRHDPVTLLHWNHLRDGRVNGWRDAAGPDEIEELARRCGQWLIARGYERDFSWAKPIGGVEPGNASSRSAVDPDRFGSALADKRAA